MEAKLILAIKRLAEKAGREQDAVQALAFAQACGNLADTLAAVYAMPGEANR